MVRLKEISIVMNKEATNKRRREWMAKDRKANPEKYKEISRRYRLTHDTYKGAEYYRKYRSYMDAYIQKRKDYITEAKSKPCTDCKVQYSPWVMQFDHREPTLKEYNVSRLRNCGSFEKIKTEIDKCDVVCANCHFERTHSRKDQRYTRKGG